MKPTGNQAKAKWWETLPSQEAALGHFKKFADSGSGGIAFNQ